jgi:hypothetical protein
MADANEPPIGAGPAQAAPWLRAHGQTIDPTRSNWCGAYTNAALDQAGIPGLPTSTGQIASNWHNYGAPVLDGPPQANDVLVLSRGVPAGQLGSHVGLATGAVRTNPKTGQIEYQMKSGNDDGNKVGVDWVPASQLAVRRGTQMADAVGSDIDQFVKGPAPKASAPAVAAASPDSAGGPTPGSDIDQFVKGPSPAATTPAAAAPSGDTSQTQAAPPSYGASWLPPVVSNTLAGVDRGLQGVMGVANTADAWVGRNVPGYVALENALGQATGGSVVPGQQAADANQQRAAQLDAQYGGGTAYWLGKLAGETIGTAPIAGPLGRVVGFVGGKLAGPIGRAIGIGAGQGAGFSAGTGGDTEDPNSNPLANAATGAVGGGILGGAGSAVMSGGRTLLGGVAPAVVSMAERLGIPLSTGEKLGGVAKHIEDASAGLPGSGAAKMAADKNAAFSQVAATEMGLPGKVDNITTPMIQQAKGAAATNMENAAGRIDLPWDNDLQNELARIETNTTAGGGSTPRANTLRNLTNQVMNYVTNKGGGTQLAGSDFKTFIQKGGMLDSALNDADPSIAGDAAQLKSALLDAAENRGAAGSADAVKDLSAARRQYKAAATVGPLIEKTVAGSEEVSPQRLATAIQKNYDMSRTGGDNPMQDMARVINATKPLPSSGTAERLQRMRWLTAGLGGGGGLAAGAGLYAYDPNAAEDATNALAGGAALAVAGRASRLGLPGSGYLPRVLGGPVGTRIDNALQPPPQGR